MIQTLSFRCRRYIAALMYLIFFVPGMAPLYTMAGDNPSHGGIAGIAAVSGAVRPRPALLPMMEEKAERSVRRRARASFIGGPATPEASSFKAVGSDNLVNLFTGDFSYSIPLLDVDGYPVNLFYNGGISMEQEASWVGLGWNINPGSVSRNMRGVPDDFNGTDMLIQEQNVKPNKTWGGEIGVDGEVVGIKEPKVNFSLGVSINNYLGPEINLGVGISVSIPITETIVHEAKAPEDSVQGLSLSLGANAKLSSRSGLTFSPSLNANLHSINTRLDLGVGLSTSYNSRTGIKDLNISSQMSAYKSVLAQKPYGAAVNRYMDHFGTLNTTISFARPSYMPTLRMPMLYTTKAGQLEFGAGMFGLRGAATAQGYYSKSEVADITIKRPLVGYMYLEKAKGRRDAVMDFNRVNDGEVTPRTPVLSAPQYDYDIFSVQGEGTGGSIRAYRSDLGFMRDNETTSRDNNFSIGADIAGPGHFGGNVNSISTPTRAGNWDNAANTLNQTLQFKDVSKTGSYEHVYFRNPGEATVTNDAMINKTGRDNLVRFQLGGTSVSPRLQSQLELFSKKTNAPMGTLPLAGANADNAKPREKRTQVITMLSASDAAKAGLETNIRTYRNSLDGSNNLQFDTIPRVGGNRKAHHISEVTVLEGNGMRYVYGLPVYNVLQKDFTFSVRHNEDAATNLVSYDADEPTTGSNSINGNDGIDGYCSVQTTPAYASSFMLTGLLSPDYVDRTGDGITEDDLGSAVKFDYKLSDSLHKWRTPRSNAGGNKAHFNPGLRTERRDNKATISYGVREAWYLRAIESKSMIAIFSTSPRQDAKGVLNELNGGINNAENANLKLDSIMLYTRSELRTKGLTNAVPLKTVHFDYSYALCQGTPDNLSGGKLTLTDIYFTFNGQSKDSKNMYVFNYGGPGLTDNPGYAYNASDRWGTYKPVKDSALVAVNPSGLSNIDYPYTSTNKGADDVFAGAWSLKKILLPSGGQIEVQYEADDYAYVQNRRACNMLKLYGIGNTSGSTQSNMLYSPTGGPDPYFVYIQLPAPLQSTNAQKQKQELFAKYLDGIGQQLALKLNISMPRGAEPLTVYANYDDYGLCPNSSDRTVAYLQLRPVDGKSPMANAAVHYLIEHLPGQVFPAYDLSGEPALPAILSMLGSAFGSLFNAFKNAEGQVRSGGKGSSIVLASSFARLAAPAMIKYGGGHRVKRLLIRDNWNKMSKQYDAQYGQDYDYTTMAKLNGLITTVSSGVASYEPGIGSEENPFREILQFENRLPLASAQYGAIEMPVLEALYPAPVVGYSKVTVRSIHRKGTHADSVVRSAVGKQVTEFYTAKDYPSYSVYTPMYNMDYHYGPPFDFFYKETIDKRTTSQGFLVETNDMHGKVRLQAAYSEKDENTPLSYTVHTYKNTGANGLNDVVDFVHHELGGTVISGNMGVDVELMTDVRELSVKSTGTNTQGQIDFFSFVPIPIGMTFIYPLDTYIENTYRSVTTTKLINYHAIEDSVIVNDKGSTVTTKTIAYDAETGSPLVNKTLNEFNAPVYTTNFPAYWAYSGMGPAWSNAGMEFSDVTIADGRITGGIPDLSVLESGDELLIRSATGVQPTCPAPSPDRNKVWVFDLGKNATSLTIPSAGRSLIVLDSAGKVFTRSGLAVRIVRSGHRNMLGENVASFTSLANPIVLTGGVRKLMIDSTSRVVAASAMEYKEKWQTDKDAIDKRQAVIDANCNAVEILDCNGYLEKSVNPYSKGLLGNFKGYKGMVFYNGRVESSPTTATLISQNGVLDRFGSYWLFNASNALVPDLTNTKWVWNSEVTRVNAHGLELETRDALNRYTSAQYGFAKKMPLAVVQNGRVGEAFSEGFEDYNYVVGGSRLSVCGNRYIDLTDAGTVINTDTSATIQAHSGKYVLKVNKGWSGSKDIAVADISPRDFHFNTFRDTALTLYQTGGVINSTQVVPFVPTDNNPAYTTPMALWQAITTFSNGGFSVPGVIIRDTFGDGIQTRMHFFKIINSYYINVLQSGNYDFHLRYAKNESCNLTGLSLSVALERVDGPYWSKYFNLFNAPSADSTGIFICKGVYKVTSTIINGLQMSFLSNPTLLLPYPVSWPSNGSTYPCNTYQRSFNGWYFPNQVWPDGGNNSWGYPGISFSTNAASINYKSLSTINGCVTNRPMAATDSMLNPCFAVTAGKKMFFSAWVREGCSGTPCTKTNYADSRAELYFDGGSLVALKPAGPIIEGWQKVEGEFTVPANVSAMTLRLVNGSTTTDNYWDDIRIHPFNAAMKSYVYDPRTLRLSAELDENNYAAFYDYDEEGQLVRVKRETAEGVKTIKETRSSKQKSIKTVQ